MVETQSNTYVLSQMRAFNYKKLSGFRLEHFFHTKRKKKEKKEKFFETVELAHLRIQKNYVKEPKKMYRHKYNHTE